MPGLSPRSNNEGVCGSHGQVLDALDRFDRDCAKNERRMEKNADDMMQCIVHLKELGAQLQSIVDGMTRNKLDSDKLEGKIEKLEGKFMELEPRIEKKIRFMFFMLSGTIGIGFMLLRYFRG